MMHVPIIVVFSPGPMRVLSTSMVRTPDHFFFELRYFCMAPILDCAMAAVMVVDMWPVPGNTTADFAPPTKRAVLFLLVFFLGHTETFVGNEAFLESMIPHHTRRPGPAGIARHGPGDRAAARTHRGHSA